MRRNSFYSTDLQPESCRPIVGARTLKRRSAFTLLEMMTAIAIILVLMAIGVIAFRALEASAARKETAAMMATLQAAVAELESKIGISRLEGVDGVYRGRAKISKDLNPGEVLAGSDKEDENRYGEAVRQTQRVIGQLMQVPSNKAKLSEISPKRLLGKPGKAYTPDSSKRVVLDTSTGGPGGPVPPVPLDGWRNPLLFVPSGGLEGVILDEKTSDPQTIVPPNNRPFWASAGPDGDFSKGDDNIYSFAKP